MNAEVSGVEFDVNKIGLLILLCMLLRRPRPGINGFNKRFEATNSSNGNQ